MNLFNLFDLKHRPHEVSAKKSREEIQRQYYHDSPDNAETDRVLAKIDTFRRGREKQGVLVTSAVLGEGKSTVSTHIAMASSRNRKSPTLLIDFDLRRPRIHHIFRQNKGPGVAEILRNKVPFYACIRNSSIANLKILTSGSLQGSPLQVINSENVKAFLKQVYNYFDFIVVDAPPVIPVSDPLILGKVVDHVVMVVRVGETSKRIVKRAIDMLNSVEINVSGIILNDVNNVLPTYYDYKYYGYPYYTETNSATVKSR
ncbi:MAG: polysaccharide biosynthesis tyrosine autokinase [Aliifodinibius sp.]|nr:CpsD/CapB family tyrosine-protein kinase [Fodinibius sp.]NIY27709.1 polysaccharide biosynthesis tyrosine autokinase [Fodinibius sp.]